MGVIGVLVAYSAGFFFLGKRPLKRSKIMNPAEYAIEAPKQLSQETNTFFEVFCNFYKVFLK